MTLPAWGLVFERKRKYHSVCAFCMLKRSAEERYRKDLSVLMPSPHVAAGHSVMESLKRGGKQCLCLA